MFSDNIGVCGWLKNSFIDFPGTVSTVLFFAGCNLRCPWCHNPDILNNSLSAVSFEKIMQYIDKRKGILDGVVMTGGEPTLHKSLLHVVGAFRKKLLQIKIDTNGLNPDIVAACEPDYCALDIKTTLSNYPIIGCTIPGYESRLLRSIEIVKKMGSRAEIRMTMVPDFIDEYVVKELIPLLKGVVKVYLQPFNNTVELLDSNFSKKTPINIEQIRKYREMIAPHVGSCYIRGDV